MEKNYSTSADFTDGVMDIMMALSDPTRRKILNLLLEKPKSVKVISADMPISQAAVSQHLKIMRDANLILDEKQGRYHIYRINPSGLAALAWHFGTLRDDVVDMLEEGQSIFPTESADYDLIDTVMNQWASVWPTHDALSVGIILRFRLIFRHLDELAKRAAIRFNIESSQARILGILDRIFPREITLDELYNIAVATSGVPEKYIKDLEERSFIERRYDDGKREKALIRITEQGRDILHRYLEAQRKHEHAAIYGMPKEERVELAKFLRNILKDLQRTQVKYQN